MALEDDYKSMCAMIRVLADHCGIDKNQDEFDLLNRIDGVVLASKFARDAADKLMFTVIEVTPVASAVLTDEALNGLETDCQQYSDARKQVSQALNFANRR